MVLPKSQLLTTSPCYLTLDTSTPTSCVGLVDQQGTCLIEYIDTAPPQAGTIVPLRIHEILNSHMNAYHLDGVLVGLGPGSFTGLRVGLALAKGIGFARQVNLLGVNSLLALAMSSHTPGIICPVMDARKAQVYTAIYNIHNSQFEILLEPGAYDPTYVSTYIQTNLKKQTLYMCGPGRALIPKASNFIYLSSEHPTCQGIYLAHNEEKDVVFNNLALETTAPNYYRLSEAEMSKQQRKGVEKQ